MDGVTGVLIRLGIRVVVFGAVFFIAARKSPRIAIHAKWAIPLVAIAFAMLNTALYWALKPVLSLATFGALAFIMPLIVNTILLVLTVKLFTWSKLPKVEAADPTPATKKAQPNTAPARRPLFEIDGMIATAALALVLTVAHGALWVALDYLPNR